MIRLDKILADMGCGTRSEVKKEIRKGLVTVDGSVEKDPGRLLKGSESITFRGERLVYEAVVYYMLNKPSGVVSATEDKKQKTVLDLITEGRKKDLFPVGRLDIDTEGLLILTNDGEMAHRLLSPAHHVEKTYFAKVRGRLTEEDVRAFAEGLELSGDFTALPAKLEIGAAGEVSDALVTICEGQFHQIKRMFLKRGCEVLYLKRLSMGPVILDEKLNPGEYRRLTEEEIRLLEEIR